MAKIINKEILKKSFMWNMCLDSHKQFERYNIEFAGKVLYQNYRLIVMDSPLATILKNDHLQGQKYFLVSRYQYHHLQ